MCEPGVRCDAAGNLQGGWATKNGSEMMALLPYFGLHAIVVFFVSSGLFVFDTIR